jgi:hypothetical protein
MGNIVNEIISVGIPCYGIYEGVPNCGELSPSDQAIVDACIACEDKNFTSAEKTALWALLDNDQKAAYTKVRDDEIRLLWVQHLEEIDHKKLWILYIYKAGSKKDMTDDFDENIAGMFPLWSDT